MAQPVLVRTYNGRKATTTDSRISRSPALPPISAYAFADILRSADSADLQSAIDGIAEICAKNRMSLAEEYASHLPPVGEITEASSRNVKPQLLKPGMRRALTSVPEASSGSSEGSRRSKRRNVFGFAMAKGEVKTSSPRIIRIGSMGRTISVGGTTAMATVLEEPSSLPAPQRASASTPSPRQPRARTVSAAANSLQRLLSAPTSTPG